MQLALGRRAVQEHGIGPSGKVGHEYRLLDLRQRHGFGGVGGGALLPATIDGPNRIGIFPARHDVAVAVQRQPQRLGIELRRLRCVAFAGEAR